MSSTRLSCALKGLLCLFAAVVHTHLQAGGLFLYEVGTPDVRFASAGWSARAEDPSTLFTNPAGMSRLCGNQALASAQPLYPHVKFNANAATLANGPSGNASALIPSGGFFATTQINDCLSAGVGALGYWGASLNYGNHWVGRYYVTKTYLQGFSFIPAVAYRISNRFSIGVAANIMYAIMGQQAAINNSTDGLGDGRLKLRDQTWGAGVILGGLYEFSGCTRLGVQYISEVKLRFRDRPQFQGLGPTLTTALGNAGILGSRVTINANVPNSIIASLYHEINPCWSIMGNGGWQQWSRFSHVELALADANGTNLSVMPQYNDTWHGALGMEYRPNCDLKLSGGIAYDSSMLTNKHRTLSLPIGAQWRFASGFAYTLCNGVLFNGGYQLLWSGDLEVDQSRGPLAARVAGEFHNVCVHTLLGALSWAF